MAGANSNFNITELDFDSIKTSLKNYMKDNGVLQDYNYEGSAISTLLDVLAYNTQYNAYYLNMVANEMFLDSALQRSSVVSHAKLLNYTPQSATAPRAQIDLVMNNVTTSSLTLPKFTSFLSEAIDGVSYKFVTLNSTTENTNLANNTVTFNDLVIKQGEPVTLSFIYDSAANPTAIFELSDTNIDTTTISVVVQQSTSNSSSQVFTLVDDYLALNGTTKAFFLQEATNGYYQIYFGDGILGEALTDGNVVSVSYIITSGTAATDANNFVLMDTISGFSSSTITPVQAATQGAEKESIESIKYTAPKSYAAQGRAVTKEDYIFLIQNNAGIFPIDAVNVWGGEENDPPVYGVVFVAIKPSGGYLLTQSQKSVIEEEIIKPISVLTVQPRIIDVDYNYLVINSNILYDPKLTTLTSSQLQTQTLTAIQRFAADTLNTFNSTFQLSTLISTVQSVSPSFITNDASITLQKRLVPSLTSSTTYTLKYGTPLKKDIFGKSISVTPTFQVIDVDNNSVVRDSVYLEETPSSTTYVESISISNPGFGYTSTPTVTILGDGTGATARATVVNGQVDSITMIDVGVNYTQAIVQITSTDGNGSLASAVAVLAGNKGTLRTYYFENNVKKILNANAGTVDYAQGVVTLTDFNPSAINSPLGVLSVQAVPTSTIVSSARDKIITLDNTDPNAININIVAKV
jgi:hypothetical protein